MTDPETGPLTGPETDTLTGAGGPPAEVLDVAESRYDRQEAITWWDQAALSAARVLVVGAGALGNELLKGAALLGVGQLTVIDLDVVSRSNLARCVLFSEADEGAPKAPVAAAAAGRLNPDVTVTGLVEDVRTRPLGWLRDFDVVLGGLDNREARLWINAACRKLGIPWIDGAIEGLRGTVRVFLPDGPCYECTLSADDRRLLAQRRSCALLTTAQLEAGRVPTTATSSAIVAAVQLQEAVKLLSGRPELLALRNTGWMFLGETLETYMVSYGQDPDCLAHDRYTQLTELPMTPQASVADLLAAADLGADAVVELEFDLLAWSACDACGTHRVVGRRLEALGPGDGECAMCGRPARLEVWHSFTVPAAETGTPDPVTVPVEAPAAHAPGPDAATPLTELDLGEGDVVTVRSGATRAHLLLTASGAGAEAALGTAWEAVPGAASVVGS